LAVEFENVKPHIGATVHLDRREDLFTEEVAAKCLEMIEQRTVIVIPRVNLTNAEQIAFTDLMGARVTMGQTVTPDEIYQITLDKKVNRQPEYVLGTFFWHMDGITIDMPPPKATLLSARRVAAQGGQTEFASTYAAYEFLPDEDKAAVKDLRAVHSVAASLRLIADAIPERERDKVLSIGLIKDHPIVWTRGSGRKSMVIGTTADHIQDQPVPHGRALLSRLQEWAVQPDFVYRHHWQEGDFVIWDNTGAMHRVLPYDNQSGRMMHRTSIAGTESVN
jgi:alpha-ketoglutarate-dependent taurine dioxygenase